MASCSYELLTMRPFTIVTAALLAAYFFGLEWPAVFVMCGLGFAASIRWTTDR